MHSPDSLNSRSGRHLAAGVDWRPLLGLVLALVPLVARGFDVGPTGLRLTALVLVPWLVAAGVPRARLPLTTTRGSARGNTTRGGVRGAVLRALALALPLLALAARLDRSAGTSLAELGRGAGVGLGLVALFAFASARTPSRSVGSARLYAAAWTALCLGLPSLRLAFPEAALLDGLWSPVSWVASWARAGSEVPPASATLFASGLAVLFLFLPGRSSERSVSP